MTQRHSNPLRSHKSVDLNPAGQFDRDPSAPRSDSKRRTLLLLFSIAFVTRATWGIIAFFRVGAEQLEFPDEQQYWLIASSFAHGQGLRDELGFVAGRMPLYPMLLSTFAFLPHALLWAKALHWIIGALAAPLTFLLGSRLVNRRAGALAGLLVALDPFLVFTSSLLLTETFFTSAQLALLLALARILLGPPRAHDSDSHPDQAAGGPFTRGIVVGLFSALCVYVRESSIGLVALLLLASLLLVRNRRVTAGVCIAAVTVMIALLPWAIRNERITGRMCWLTFRGGISLYDGVREGATGASDLADVKQMPAVRDLTEPQWDDYFRRQACQLIRDDPPRVLRLSLTKIARMWNPIPNVDAYRSPAVRTIAAAWNLPLFLGAILGLATWSWLNQGKPWTRAALLLLPILYFTLLHGLFVGSIRYRLPVLPLVAILAAHGISVILERFRVARAGR